MNAPWIVVLVLLAALIPTGLILFVGRRRHQVVVEGQQEIRGQVEEVRSETGKVHSLVNDCAIQQDKTILELRVEIKGFEKEIKGLETEILRLQGIVLERRLKPRSKNKP